jgi:hypothetical protein
MKTTATELLYNQKDAFSLIAKVAKRIVENNILSQEKSDTSPLNTPRMNEIDVVCDVAEKELKLSELRKFKLKKQKRAQNWLNYKQT